MPTSFCFYFFQMSNTNVSFFFCCCFIDTDSIWIDWKWALTKLFLSIAFNLIDTFICICARLSSVFVCFYFCFVMHIQLILMFVMLIVSFIACICDQGFSIARFNYIFVRISIFFFILVSRSLIALSTIFEL